MGIEIGQRLGQYLILSLLGEGGMATVYRAQQENVGRQVAIKVINAEYARDPAFRSRFEREARTIAALSHPHILKLFDYGQQDDTAYLVMELMSGGSLNDLLQKGKLTPTQAGKYLSEISGALDYAHAQGVIHRDLKPHNVLLDATGNAFLTDFGLARILSGTSQMTQSGILIGTVGYMSPEQWRGEPATPASDIYSLGIMVYEMLAGKRPFEVDSTHGMMYAHLSTPPPREKLPADLPPDMLRVLERALAKQPEARYQRAIDFANDFQNALVRKPLATQPFGGKSTAGLSELDIQLIEIAPQPTAPFPATPTTPLTPSTPPVPASRPTPILGIISAVSLTILAITALVFLILNLRPVATPAPTNTTAPTVTVAPTNTTLPTSTTLPTNTIAPTLTTALTLPPTLPPEPTRPPLGGNNPPPTPLPGSIPNPNDLPTPAPVEAGEQLILVTRVDRAGEVPTPATPRIIQNLRNNLEATPGSTIRIREMQFPAFNADDALRIARQYHAAVIIWGVIDDRRTNFNIQLGDYASFGSAKISEATLRRSSDVVQLTTVNPDASSLDTLVLNALRLGYLASDDAYHAAMIQALADKTPVSFDPMLTEMTNQVALAAVLAEAGQPDKALEMLNNAITQDSTNPFSYLYRAEVRHAAKQDVKTADTIANDLRLARQYGAKGWLAPDFIELSFADATNNLEQVVTLAGKILESSPDNWYILTQRATAYLLTGKLPLAKADAERAVGLKPASPLPYLVAATIATQEGNFPLAQQRTTETKTLGAAGKLVTLAEPRNPSEIEVFHAALVAAALGQNVTALQKLDQALLLQADARIINLQKGLLYCSAENYPDSETTLSNEIKRAPDAYVLFALRAAVRRKQGKIADADADTAEAIKIPNASLKPTLQRMAEGGLSCQALTQPAK